LLSCSVSLSLCSSLTPSLFVFSLSPSLWGVCAHVPRCSPVVEHSPARTLSYFNNNVSFIVTSCDDAIAAAEHVHASVLNTVARLWRESGLPLGDVVPPYVYGVHECVSADLAAVVGVDADGSGSGSTRVPLGGLEGEAVPSRLFGMMLAHEQVCACSPHPSVHPPHHCSHVSILLHSGLSLPSLHLASCLQLVTLAEVLKVHDDDVRGTGGVADDREDVATVHAGPYPCVCDTCRVTVAARVVCVVAFLFWLELRVRHCPNQSS
jgi:hypothetical protein